MHWVHLYFWLYTIQKSISLLVYHEFEVHHKQARRGQVLSTICLLGLIMWQMACRSKKCWNTSNQKTLHQSQSAVCWANFWQNIEKSYEGCDDCDRNDNSHQKRSFRSQRFESAIACARWSGALPSMIIVRMIYILWWSVCLYVCLYVRFCLFFWSPPPFLGKLF